MLLCCNLFPYNRPEYHASALCADTDATGLSVQDRGVGFVFQSYALFKHMTLAENIAFGPKTRKLDMDIDGRCGVVTHQSCSSSAVLLQQGDMAS